MAVNANVTNVFISYYPSTKDQQIADNLSKYLPKERYFTQLSKQDPEGRIPVNTQWVILVRTPNAIDSRTNKTLEKEVNNALQLYLDGKLQGVLAVATPPTNQDAVESIPPNFSTISTYDLGAGEKEWPNAFEKVVKTIGYSAGRRNSENIDPQQQIGGQSGANPSGAVGGKSVSGAGFGNFLKKPIFRALAVAALIILVGGGVFYSVFPPFHPSIVTNHPTPTATHAVSGHVQTPDDLYKKTTTQSTPIATFASTTFDKNVQLYDDAKCKVNSDKKPPTYTISYKYVQQGVSVQPCLLPKQAINQDFAFQVKMKIDAGDAGGIIFQSDDSLKSFYRFSLSNDGNYKLIRCDLCSQPDQGGEFPVNQNLTPTPSGQTTIASIAVGSATPTQTPSESVKLAVIVSNSTIYLYIAGKFVAKTPNVTTDQGSRIGMYAATTSATDTKVTFTDLQVWNLS